QEYAKKRMSDQETISKHPLQVPPIVFETVGFWMTLPDALEQEAVLRERHLMGGLHGAEHAMISLFPLLALCDRSDIGGISSSRNMQLGAPASFIFDRHPGRRRRAPRAHDPTPELFPGPPPPLAPRPCDAEGPCRCEEGCPSCVQSPKCGSGNRPLDKESSRLVLAHLAGGIATFVPCEPRAPETSAAPHPFGPGGARFEAPAWTGSTRPSSFGEPPFGAPLPDDELPRVVRRIGEREGAHFPVRVG